MNNYDIFLYLALFYLSVFLIINNQGKIHTTENGSITIDGQTFILKAVIIQTGGFGGGHYMVITEEGFFDDNDVRRGSRYMKQIKKSNSFHSATGVYYFFENTILRGGNIKDNYFHKYLKYKNKYLELSKLKSQKIGRY